MFAAVHYIDTSAKSAGIKRKHDVIEVDNIKDFTMDYERKKFKVTTPEGPEVSALILSTGSKPIL